jgi:hypothetical protein
MPIVHNAMCTNKSCRRTFPTNEELPNFCRCGSGIIQQCPNCNEPLHGSFPDICGRCGERLRFDPGQDLPTVAATRP